MYSYPFYKNLFLQYLFQFREKREIFFKDTQGGIAIMGTFFVLIAGTLAGVSVDYARFLDTRARLRSATDSAALKFAESLTKAKSQDEKQALEKKIGDFIKANFSRKNLESFDTANIQITQTEQGGRRLKVTATATVRPYFGAFFRMMGSGSPKDKGVQISWETVAAPARTIKPTIEMVLALDNTGSMNKHNRKQDLVQASRKLLDIMFPDGGEDLKTSIGLVLFNNLVKVPAEDLNTSWLVHQKGELDVTSKSFCLQPRKPPYNIKTNDIPSNKNSLFPVYDGIKKENCDELSPSVPLSKNKSSLLTVLDKIDNTVLPPVGTDVSLGIFWALRMLSPGKPFSGSSNFGGNDLKAMVVLTDGQNLYNLSGDKGKDTKKADSAQRALCRAAKDKNVQVYTIAFSIGKGGRSKTDKKKIKKLLKDCASSPSHYFNAKDGKALSEAFEKIANDVKREYLRLVQ